MTDLELREQARRAFVAGYEIFRTEAARAEAAMQARLAERDRVDVWIAAGLRLRWRVVSDEQTYGEWDDYGDAIRFLDLLADGNQNLRRLA